MSLSIAQIDSHADVVLIAVNPRAGSRAQQQVVDDLVHRLKAKHLVPHVYNSVDALVAEYRRSYDSGRLRAVVAGGGDGTARMVAERTDPGTPLTLLPLGTENLLARHLGLSMDTQALSERIAGGYTVQLDAGEANGRLFTLMVGCGFDADVVRRLHRDRRGNIHHFSYVKPILDAIRNYDYPPLRVEYPHVADRMPGSSASESIERRQLTARWVFVVNLPRYAGGLNFAPDASGTDGLLDICTFKEGSLYSGLVYLGGVFLGKHQDMEDFQRVRAPELTIESILPVPYQMDGDPGGELPLTIRVLPRRLTVLVTPSWAERHGFDTRGCVPQ